MQPYRASTTFPEFTGALTQVCHALDLSLTAIRDRVLYRRVVVIFVLAIVLMLVARVPMPALPELMALLHMF